MLSEKLRAGVQGRVFKVIFFLIILSFIFTGVGGYLIPRINTDPVQVGDYKIRASEWDGQYNAEVRARMQYLGGSDLLENKEYLLELKRSVLENMINNVALNAYAFDAGIRVGDDQVRDAIANNTAFFKDGKFDNTLYLATLKASGLSPDYYGEQIRISQMSTTLTTPLVSAYVAPFDNEVKYLYELLNQKRIVDLYSISNDAYLNDIKISDEEALAFYNANAKKYFEEKASVKFNYILLTQDDVKKSIKYTDEDLQNYYNLNSNLFKGSFEENKDKVIEAYLQEESKKIYNQKVTSLADISFENPDSLEEAARVVEAKILDSGVVVQGKSDYPYPLSEPSVQALAFNENNIESNINSDVINLGDDKALVLNVYEYQESAIKSFDKVKAEASNLAAIEKSKVLAKNALQEIASALTTKQKVANQYLQTQQDVVYLRNQSTEATRFDTAIFAIPNEKDHNYIIEENGDKVTLAVLKSVSNNDAIDYETYAQLISSQLVQINMIAIENMIYSGARSLVDVKYNDDAIKLAEQGLAQ